MDMISAIDLRAGDAFEYNGSVWQVLDQNFMKPGKGNAVMRVQMREFKSGSQIWTTFNPSAKFKKCEIDKRDMLFSYINGDNYVFMDSETYEELELSADQLGIYKDYIVEGQTVCTIMMCEDDILGIQTKTEKVELEVVECDPGVKGDTAQNARKKAKLETGLIIDVPLFIEAGDRIVVSTVDGQYRSRA